MTGVTSDDNEPGIPFTGSARWTAHEYVREVLRRAILNGELEGGTRLVQAELASSLDVSTTPVREALRDLASEGLIRFDPHRGAVVSELDAVELEEVYAIRLLLEPNAMRQAVAHMTDEIVDRLRELHEKMAEETLSVSFVDLNRSFHMAIYEAAVSPRLVSIIRSLEDAAVMYIGASLKTDAGLREAAVHDHAEILAALEARDADAAEAAIRRHLTLSLRALDNRVAKEADGSSR